MLLLPALHPCVISHLTSNSFCNSCCYFCYLCHRYVSAKAKGRADLDWSAIGMDISEAAGIDVSKDVSRNIQDVKDGRTY